MWHRAEPFSGDEQGIIKNQVVPEELDVGNAGMLPAAMQAWSSPALSWANTQENITETSGSTGINLGWWERVTAPRVPAACELESRGCMWEKLWKSPHQRL